MTATPGSKAYGRLTVALAARCSVEALFTIKPGAFRPAPQVQSAFARLIPLPEPRVSEAETSTFDNVLRAAFGQRRKQLGNSLGTLLTTQQIADTGIDPTLRAEQLDVEEYLRLTRAVMETQKQ